MDTNTMDLDRVSVRRMMFYIDKKITQLAYEKGFHCNTLEEKILMREQCANEVLQDVQQRKGIFDFKVEHVGPLKAEAKIVFLEDQEPITIIWAPTKVIDDDYKNDKRTGCGPTFGNRKKN